jgi:hypothetical protein
MQDLSHAQAYATMISNFLDETQRTIEVQIEQRPDLQFSFDLMDAIPFTAAKLAINTTYYAGLIEHRWQAENGQSVITTLVMRPRLTDAAAVSNDVEDPDLPYIPETPLPPGGWVPLTTTPIINPVDPLDPGGCLSNVSAIANGPFDLLLNSINLISNGNTQYSVDTPGVWARPGGFDNPTKIAVTGDWQKYNPVTAQWDGDITNDWWNVQMNNTYLTKGTYTDGGTGTRVLSVDLGGEQAMTRILFSVVPTSESAFTIGSTISTGSVSANDADGVQITGLTIGNYYSIESSGGPWHAEGEISSAYDFTINNTLVPSATSPKGADWSGQFGLTNGSLSQLILGSYAIYAEFLDAQHARAYFYASTERMSFRVNAYYPSNTGSLGYVIRNVQPDTIYRLNILQVSLYNICSA